MVFSGILCFSFMTLTVVAYHFPTVMTQYAKTVSENSSHLMSCDALCVGHDYLPVIIRQAAGNSSITSCRFATTMIIPQSIVHKIIYIIFYLMPFHYLM